VLGVAELALESVERDARHDPVIRAVEDHARISGYSLN
jgi:hypothetical protein